MLQSPELFDSLWWWTSGLTIAFTAMMLFAVRFLEPHDRTRYARGLGRILLLWIAVPPTVHALTGYWEMHYGLPLQWCDFAGAIAGLALLTRRQGLYELSLFWGITGAASALLTPQFTQGTDWFFVVEFFVSHWMLLTAPFLLSLYEGMRPRRWSWLAALGWLNVAALIVGAFDYLTGANYMFLFRAPDADVALYRIEWPYYLVGFEIGCLLAFALIDLPFRIFAPARVRLRTIPVVTARTSTMRDEPRPTTVCGHTASRLMAPLGPFAHRVDLVPFAVACSIAAAQAGLFIGAGSREVQLLGVLLLWPLTTISIAIAHGHFHVRTFRHPWLNRIYEFVLFYECGMPSFGWELNHNFGHHRHFMQQNANAPLRDEYYWLEPDGRITPRWRYTFRTAALAYYYAVRNGRERPDYLRKFRVVMLLHALVLGALFAYDAIGTLICYLGVIVANMFVNAWFSYSHHAGLSLEDRYSASYSNLNRLENLLTFNTGYHTAHHVRASVHWYELPTFHAKIRDRVPAHCCLSGSLTHEDAVARLAITRRSGEGAAEPGSSL